MLVHQAAEEEKLTGAPEGVYFLSPVGPGTKLGGELAGTENASPARAEALYFPVVGRKCEDRAPGQAFVMCFYL